MSMLSEQRKKTKWVVNPTKKPLWSTDSSGIKFGKELMQKMGWSAGKGLGLNEQGIQEPLRVSYKNDTKGMGFKGNDDDWIGHQDKFNSLLNQLRNGEDSFVVEVPEEEKREIKSLVEKSKTSKARVHYQKFTRGKDLSKYTENDLACIIGTNKMKKEKPKTEEIIKTESQTNGNCETSFGVTTINSGSLQDYFKRKWIINKNKCDESDMNNIESLTENISKEKFSTCNRQNFEEDEEKKLKRKKHKSKSEQQLPTEEMIPQSDVLESSGRIDKRKRMKKENEISSDNEPKKKKKRKNSDSNDAVEGEISLENDTILAQSSNFKNQDLDSFPKKRVKEKNYLETKIADDESSCVKEKKKRKKTIKNNEETSTSDLALNEEIHVINANECKLNKKKNKNEKILKNSIEPVQSCSKKDEPSPTQNDATESSLHENSSKSKKIKKRKRENSEEMEKKSISTDLREYSCPNETDAKKFNIEVENDENKSSKKKKKKAKKEKSTEEKYNCLNNENKNSVAVEVESVVEVEFRKKKKMEKREKLEENNCRNENEESLNENISEELVKKKEKKRETKEKSSKHENEENQTVPEEREVGSVKKKKKKKELKLQKGNESQKSCQVEPIEEPKLEKSGTEKILEGIDSSQAENNPVSGSKTEGERRIEKLKVNLFGDEASEKYFPHNGSNERVLKLIKWANFSEFKGSNLRDVEGYGWKLMHQRQVR